MAWLVVAGAAVACASDERPAAFDPSELLTVQVVPGALVAADTTTAGWRRVRLEGAADDDHNLVVFRLPREVAVEAFIAALDTAAMTPLGAVALGGPDGASTDALVRLEPGKHLVACLVRGDDGPRHAALGEWTIITATSPDGHRISDSVAVPGQPIEIDLQDFTFAGEIEWPSGAQVLHVRNSGAQDHLVLITRLHDGRTFREWVDAEDPATVSDPPVGVSRLSPGRHAYVPVHLIPGSYVLYCLVRDPGTAKLHTAMGMMRVIRVSS